MADLNKVFLIGRLTFDPELRHTPSGAAVADLRLATSRYWQDKSGEKKEETLYVDVTVWQKQAETCCQHLRKGSQVHVEGFLKSETWDDKTTGEKRSKIKVEADRVQFLDKKVENSEDSPQPQRQAPAGKQASAAGRPQGSPGYGGAPSSTPRRQPTPPKVSEKDDDIPF